MKTTSTLLVALLTFGASQAQEKQVFVNELGQTVSYAQATSFFKTPPVSEWPEAIAKTNLASQEVKNRKEANEAVNTHALPNGMDPALQTAPPFRAAAQTLVNFSGMSGSGVPPDPSGAAGPNHYVQAVNTLWRVYDKTGAPLGNTMTLSSLWPTSSNQGDPIVMYDRHADRWFMSQFQSGPNQILIAISETPDPLGSWYAYTFAMGQFPDYPKYSIWWDGYYMTSNSNQTAVAFERDKMLIGDQSAGIINLSAPSLSSIGFRSPLPADADGPLPPNGTPMYIFNLEDDAWGGVSQDRIKIYEFTVDWNTISNSQVSVSQNLTTDPFDTNFGFGFDNISQPNSNQKLDAIPGVFMYRAQHMRFAGYNSVLLCHVVDVNGQDHAGMRWYELRDADNGNWNIYQQGTYSPDAADRFMGSISQDNAGNIGMAYSHINAADGLGAGLRYTGRWASDPLGEMSMFENEAIPGNGAQSGTNRFGDYGHMTLDPDGTTLWHTGEYLTPTRRTRIFSFNIQSALSVAEQNPADLIELNINVENTLIAMHANGLESFENVRVELIDLHGKVLETKIPQGGSGTLYVAFNMYDKASGIYFVRLASDKMQKVGKVVYGQ